MIEDLRSLLTSRRSHVGFTYLFPGRHPYQYWKHLHPDSPDKIVRKAFERTGIEEASTDSFSRTALTSDEQRRNWAADYSRNKRDRSNLEQLQREERREGGSSQRSVNLTFHAFLQGERLTLLLRQRINTTRLGSAGAILSAKGLSQTEIKAAEAATRAVAQLQDCHQLKWPKKQRKQRLRS